MLGDIETRAMLQQTIEDIGRFMGGGRDDLHMIRAMLVGYVGIKSEPRIDAVSGIYITAGLRPLSGAEELTV